MDDIDAIASFSAAQSQARISNAVALKLLKIANQQQKSVLTLLDAVVQPVEPTQQADSAGNVDVRA